MEAQWISALEAFTRLYKARVVNPPRTICSRAADGVIVAKAKTLFWGNERRYDWKIPAKFWWARGERALTQNWRTGDFETWLEGRLHCRAYGVSFLESDIQAMLPVSLGNLKVERAGSGDFAPARDCQSELAKQVGCRKEEAGSHIIRFCRAGLIESRCDEISWEERDSYGTRELKEQHASIPSWFWDKWAHRAFPEL